MDHVIDHSLQSHFATIVHRKDPGHSCIMEIVDFVLNDHSSTATEYFDMAGSLLFQQFDHVFEILYMSTLIRTNSNTLNIFLNSAINNLMHRAIMTQMNHLYSTTLQNSTHDIDTGIMTIKQTGSRYKTNLMSRFMRLC